MFVGFFVLHQTLLLARRSYNIFFGQPIFSQMIGLLNNDKINKLFNKHPSFFILVIKALSEVECFIKKVQIDPDDFHKTVWIFSFLWIEN